MESHDHARATQERRQKAVATLDLVDALIRTHRNDEDLFCPPGGSLELHGALLERLLKAE